MTEIALFLSAPALIWGGWLMLRGSLVVGCSAVLIAMCCFSGEWWSVEAGGLDWSLDRFLLIGMTLAFVLQWRLGKIEPKPFDRHDAVMGAFIGVLLASTFTHDWRVGDEENGTILMHLVNGYAVPVALLAIARFSALDERQWQRAMALLAGFGIYLAITAILEIHGQWSLVFPSYIGDAKRGIHFGRARGPMLQSARLGLYLITCGTITCVLLGRKASVQRGKILLLGVLLPLYLAAVYYTYTRSVWMGTALATMIIVGLQLRGRARLFAAVVLLSGLVVGVAVKGESLIAFKREYSAAETLQSTQMRASFAYVSWKMFLDRPLVGVGFGHFSEQSRYYLSDRSTGLHLEHIRGYIHHNTFLSLLVEMGLAALLLYLAMLAHWVRSAWLLNRNQTNPEWVRLQGLFTLCLLAAYSFQLLFREVSYSPVENSLVFVFAGLTTSLRWRYHDARHRPASGSARASAVSGVGSMRGVGRISAAD